MLESRLADQAPPAPLLAADEPPPYECVNPLGHAPLLLLCDHASRRVPAALGELGLHGDDLYRHIAWDIGAADVTRRLAVLLDAPAVMGCYSRLVIDLNRFPGQRNSIPAISDGVPVPGNQGLSAAERRRREDQVFYPYHDQVAAAIARILDAGTVPVIFSVHSFTPVMEGVRRPWHVGVLWERDGRLAKPLMRCLDADPGIEVGDNLPYAASNPEGYTMRTHALTAGLPHVLVEIRQDLIDTHHGANEWAERLCTAVRELLRDTSIHAILTETAKKGTPR